jgi:hypothetical protein
MRERGSLLSRAVCRLVAGVLLAAGCASPSSTVTLLVSSNAPVKGTATELTRGALQAVRDWADAKTQIEDIHVRRVTEMLAIEADASFLQGVALIDATPRPGAAQPDKGRLETLLGIRAGDPTFDEQVQAALLPPRRLRQPETYFRTYLATIDDAAEPAEKKVFNQLWADLRQMTGEKDLLNGKAVAAWMVKGTFTTWERLITLFAREDAQRGTVVTGADVVARIEERARELGLDPPPIAIVGAVTRRAIDRMRHRRDQFPKVDRLLSSVNTIARDLDTYLQNDADAIHWKELGEALGKAQDVSTRFTGSQP